MSGSGSGLLDQGLLKNRGCGDAYPKGKWIRKFWCQSGAFFVEGGSKFYELSYWIHL